MTRNPTLRQSLERCCNWDQGECLFGKCKVKHGGECKWFEAYVLADPDLVLARAQYSQDAPESA